MPDSPIPPQARVAIGGLGLALAAGSVAVPAPWGVPVAALGALAAALAGFSAPSPAVVEGKPLLQGGALAAAGSAALVLQMSWAVIPAGWPQSVALAALTLLCWATGKVLPQVKGPSAPAPGPTPPVAP
jgi:hypothetical protein